MSYILTKVCGQGVSSVVYRAIKISCCESFQSCECDSQRTQCCAIKIFCTDDNCDNSDSSLTILHSTPAYNCFNRDYNNSTDVRSFINEKDMYQKLDGIDGISHAVGYVSSDYIKNKEILPDYVRCKSFLGIVFDYYNSNMYI